MYPRGQGTRRPQSSREHDVVVDWEWRRRGMNARKQTEFGELQVRLEGWKR